tara:strand:+ start:293 stop:664 length:372 start_codon:yes stop_codon:yes gene_type:complete
MATFDLLSDGISSFGAMIFIGLFLLSFCFSVHLIVTWNPYHRPVIPLVCSILICTIPATLLTMEEDGSTSIGEMLEVFFLLTSLGAGMVLLWLPIILLFVTIMMFSLTKRKPSPDPLIEMIEN